VGQSIGTERDDGFGKLIGASRTRSRKVLTWSSLVALSSSRFRSQNLSRKCGEPERD
jgi:hypothetical protein